MTILMKSEEDFAQNVTNLLIQCGENWIRLTNELFERDGFVVDIKSLYIFALNLKTRIKLNITRSLKDIRLIIRQNIKFYQFFYKHLLNISNEYVAEIEAILSSDYKLVECWDDYKAVYLETAFDSCNEVHRLSSYQIKYLHFQYDELSRKVLSEIKVTRALMLKKYLEPFKNRMIVRYYVSIHSICNGMSMGFVLHLLLIFMN